MAVIHLSAHQTEVLAEMVAAHNDVQDIDVMEDDHGSVLVNAWTDADTELHGTCAEDRLVFRVSVSIGGTVRDMMGATA